MRTSTRSAIHMAPPLLAGCSPTPPLLYQQCFLCSKAHLNINICLYQPGLTPSNIYLPPTHGSTLLLIAPPLLQTRVPPTPPWVFRSLSPTTHNSHPYMDPHHLNSVSFPPRRRSDRVSPKYRGRSARSYEGTSGVGLWSISKNRSQLFRILRCKPNHLAVYFIR